MISKPDSFRRTVDCIANALRLACDTLPTSGLRAVASRARLAYDDLVVDLGPGSRSRATRASGNAAADLVEVTEELEGIVSDFDALAAAQCDMDDWIAKAGQPRLNAAKLKFERVLAALDSPASYAVV